MMVFGAYTLVGIWQNNQFCALTPGPQCYNDVRDPLDLAVVAAALTGACFGFLWWNAAPAKIFMGDTGRSRSAARWPALRHDPHGAAADRARRAVRDHHAVGDPAGRLLQADEGQTALPDGPAAAPLRAARLGRGHDRRSGSGSSAASAWRPASASSMPTGSSRAAERCLRRESAGSRTRRATRRGTRSHVVVPGLGVSGFAAADALQHLGARVTVVDDARRRDRARRDQAHAARDPRRRRAARTGVAAAKLPDGADLVVTSPGWPPSAGVFGVAARRAAYPSGATSSSPGGCATPTTPPRGCASPAPTARRRRSRCSRRCCAPTACGPSRPATSGCRCARS